MVYLHVPFCRSFCSYCDFYSEIACRDRDAQDFEAFTDAVCAEIALRRDEIEATRDLDTLYIGGGTPSVLPLSLLRKMAAATIMTGGPFNEFTIEVNPEDIVERGAEYVRGLLALGVNRISMGVQSLDDGILRWMNRRHDAARARQAFRILREAGAQNISVDIIFGLSQLSREQLETTVAEILSWRPEHISAYQLSIEPGSTLGRLVREGRYTEAPQEQCAAQYALLCDRLRAAGYVHYEVSNYALPGRECRHNLVYWRRGEYLGLGLGAASLIGDMRFRNTSDPTVYRQDFCAREESEKLSRKAQMEETMFLGLRCLDGISIRDFEERFGCRIDSVYGDVISRYTDLGLLKMEDGRIMLTGRGMDVSNLILADFLL